ncbi:aaa family atpase [Fusarium longipes]|uniref:Aaa family atpase n=1 Tax=Fusarium longipes TaxID=694270 RepID=A0A395SZB4_9HYPO|nr:aaa family atpase [Fusarium longipes]
MNKPFQTYSNRGWSEGLIRYSRSGVGSEREENEDTGTELSSSDNELDSETNDTHYHHKVSSRTNGFKYQGHTDNVEEEQESKYHRATSYPGKIEEEETFFTTPTSKFTRHLTISRDQTHASSFDKERLSALLEQGPGDVDQVLDPKNEEKETIRVSIEKEEIDPSRSGFTVRPSWADFPRVRPEPSAAQIISGRKQRKRQKIKTKIRNDESFNESRTTIPLPTTDMEQASNNDKKSPVPNHVQIAQLESEIKRLRKVQNTLKSTTWIVLHKILGDETTYLSVPSWASRQGHPPHFRGNSPLVNEDDYLRDRPDAAFVVYRYYDPSFQGKDVRKAEKEGLEMPLPSPSYEVVQPLSERMISALDAFARFHPKFRETFPHWRASDPIQSPFLFWYSYRDSTNLQAMAEPHRKQMILLTEWIDNKYSGIYADVEETTSRGLVSTLTMPFLIRPGEVLVSENEKCNQGFIASSWPKAGSLNYTEPSSPNGPRKVTQTWSVGAWCYGYDGRFYKDTTTLNIELEYDEDNPKLRIAELNIFPIRFGDSKLRAKLSRRGRTMWACRGRNLIAYDTSENTLSSGGERYMIDFNTYKHLHSDSTKFKTTYSSLTNPHLIEMDPALMECENPPEGPELFIFPSSVVGYNLRQKKWQDLQVDLIQKVQWNKQAFKHLVIDDEIKDIIQALVTRKLETDQTTDFIQGKGNGLIILLHGGPGTGKTFTAESVAELAEKPLFRVTCGDIGTKPEEVEKYLESVLHLGKIWGCVVLLDEADVFLEQRTLTDLERNALVSVFLRVLEYYEGILILTSNRVGTFDEAFKSRIQLSLHYENLTKSQRRTIWSNFLERLNKLEKESSVLEPITERKRKQEEDRGINFDDLERHLTDLAEEQMNGRQIRNAITTARQLANFKDESMTYKHLNHVIKISRKFDKYIEKVRDSYSDDHYAREEGMR